MSDSLAHLIQSRLPIVGLAAYGLFASDRVLASQCLSKSLYPSHTEHMLSEVVHSARTLLPAGQDAARYCWVFECLRIYIASRPDGYCLALMVENNPGVQQGRIQEMLKDFFELADV